MATLFKLLAAVIVSLLFFYSTIIAMSYFYAFDAAANFKSHQWMQLRALLTILSGVLVVGFILLVFRLVQLAAATGMMTSATRKFILARLCFLIFVGLNSLPIG